MIALLLFAAIDAPTLEQITRLPPAAAGELALRGQLHAPIVEVGKGERGPLPPEVKELEMVERATAIASSGRTRRRWTVTFVQNYGDPLDLLHLDRASAAVEVALARGEACPNSGYVGLNTGVDPMTAVAEIMRIRSWQAGRATPRYRCTDETQSDLCESTESLQTELARLPVWMISRDGDTIAVWLGKRGNVVTELRYRPADLSEASVTRRIPAPF